MVPNLRPSPLAGSWYENDPVELARNVDGYLDHAVLPELPGKVLGVIAPHAGHVYSGSVAGYAFSALRGRTPDLVVIFSPFHNFHPSPFLTSAHGGYSTPLGSIAIDHDAVDRLDVALRDKTGQQGLTRISRDREHSLEIELPFLQRALAAPFQILPVMIRSQEPRLAEGLGKALAASLRGRNFVLVASTDLSHFFSQADAKKYDTEMLRQMEAFSPDGLFNAEQSGKGYACGVGAVAAILHASRALGADKVKVLHHATSGDVTGDMASVVGYGAAAILKSRL